MTLPQLREHLKTLSKKGLESHYEGMTETAEKFKTKQHAIDAIMGLERARYHGKAFLEQRKAW